MPKDIGLKLSLLLAMVISVGCLMTKEDIAKQDEERQLKEQVKTIQKSSADTDLRYNDVENDIRAVAGKLESLEHTQQTNHQADRQEIENLKKTIEAQNEKMKLLEQHVEGTDARLNASLQALATSPPPSAKNEGAPTASGKNSGTFNDAESLFTKKEFKKALVKYQSYRDKNPKGSKVAEATYKIGICLAELGLKKEAKEMFQETIESYPGTPSAKKAKFRLTQLK